MRSFFARFFFLDQLTFCVCEEQCWNPKMAQMMVYSTGKDGKGLFGFVKGHQRIVALHMVCNYFYVSKNPMPQWLLSMCQRVPAEVTQHSGDGAALHGLAKIVDEELSGTKWSYVTVALLVHDRNMKSEARPSSGFRIFEYDYRVLLHICT